MPLIEKQKKARVLLSFFFSLVYINKAEKTDTHIFIYQTHPGNSLRMATFIPDRDQHI